MESYYYITPKDGGIYIEFSYDPDFKELLKDRVPARFRKYNPATQTWWVHKDYERQIRVDAKSCFGNVIEC